MKMITAVIKHFKLDDVRKGLTDIGIQGMTVIEVKGFGRQKGHMEVYRGIEYEVQFLPKIKIEVAVSKDRLDEILNVIQETARSGESGEIGDGKIFVYDLQDVIRIRTGRRGEEAI
ncbi:nitrogen regulatory protein P-II 2 [bacterium BMS3Bbin09]|nr:nitrogen regulatory protein P-II 2 [bacterium BMS3Bbin09]HDH34004.1 P-II family nitrogen regulator [Nitrospirota bacterium]